LQARRVAIDALLKAGKAKRAVEVIEPLHKAHPDDLELALAHATAAADAGDTATARTIADALKGEPIVVAYVRARIRDHIGDESAAIAALEPALKKSPEHVGALNLCGYLLADRKERLADAERYLAKARDLQPGDPSILDSWGWLRFQQGKTKEAVAALDRAARFAPREPEILVHLATAQAAAGAPRKAAELLDRAKKLGPSPALERRIDALRASLAIR